MKIERVVFDPADRFMEHLKKQGIDCQVEYDKRYPAYIDNISFTEPENYKAYKGCVGVSQIFREIGTKKWRGY